MLIDIVSDLRDALSLPGKPDGRGGGFGPLNAFRMVMGNFRNLLRQLKSFLKAGCRIRTRADPHRRSIAIAVVRSGILRIDPRHEVSAITSMRILAPQSLHAGNSRLSQLAEVMLTAHDGLGDGQTHDAVISSETLKCQELEVFGLVIIPFKPGSDDVTDDRSDHSYPLL